MIDTGIDPHRLAISGRGEFQPEASNATDEGRNHKRRAKLIVLGAEEEGADADSERAIAAAVPATSAHDVMLAPSTPGAHIPRAP